MAIVRLATAQSAVLTAAQLHSLGATSSNLSDYVAAGRLFRIHRGVYSLVPPKLLTPKGWRLAAVLVGGAGAGLSHLTAGIHIGFLAGSTPRTLDITVPRRSGHGNHTGVRIHRSSTLRPQDVTDCYGIPCTTVARTILDLATVLSKDKLEEAIENCLRMDIVEIRDLYEQVDHNSGRPEAARLAKVLDEWDVLNALTENELEKRLYAGLKAAGLPQPQPQVWLDLGDGGPRIRADFMYVNERCLLETDGWRTHGHRREQDSVRDQRVARAGLRTLRITRRQVWYDPARVIETTAIVYAQCRQAEIAAGRIGPDDPPVWVPPGTTLKVEPLATPARMRDSAGVRQSLERRPAG